MRLGDIRDLPPAAQAHIGREIYAGVVSTIVDRLLEHPEPEKIPARPLYNIYLAFATGEMGQLHRTIAELGEDRTGDELVSIKLEILRRLRRARELWDDEEGQIREEQRCRDDVAYWIDMWGWARDPERDGLRVLPFKPFDRQVELLHWFEELIRDKQGGYLDKGRKVGASYIVAFFAAHRWKYFDQWSTILSSYTERALHTQNQPDECIIEKIRVVLQGLPTWQLPRGFSERDHFNFCSVVNPDNGSTITGVLPNGENLRSMRASIAFLDEAPLYKDLKNSHTIIADVTPTPIALGTPMPGSYAVELKKSVRTFMFPWIDDPRKPRDEVEVEWNGELVRWPRFKAEWILGGANRTEADFEREHCCNADIAIAQTLIQPAWIDAAQRIQLAPVGEHVVGLDPAGLGGDESVVCRRAGPHVEPLIAWSRTEERVTSERAAGHTRQFGGDYLYFDASGLGSRCRDHFGEMGDLCAWHGIFAQDPPDAIFVGDDTELATDRYADQTTMLWFELAAQLERTYRHFTGLQEYDESMLISLPKGDDKLREQLLARTWEWRSGKIKLTDKKRMKKSPDRADALSLTCSTHLQRRSRRASNRSLISTASEIDDRMSRGRFKPSF